MKVVGKGGGGEGVAASQDIRESANKKANSDTSGRNFRLTDYLLLCVLQTSNLLVEEYIALKAAYPN